jgi:acetate kinase
MNSTASRILTINAGSSTLRFALFDDGDHPRARFRGKIERIGTTQASWKVDAIDARTCDQHPITASSYSAAADYLLDWLDRTSSLHSVGMVAHRVVHGMTRSVPERVSPALLSELNRMVALDPEHLPFEIALMTAFERRYPDFPQLACFDTTFHRGMPQIARRVPIPRRYQSVGIERYGFHGLSYAFLMEELARLGDPAAHRGRVILAHLGNGASLAAVRDGQGIDTSMGLTPASGMMMGTRSGDLDPGLSYFLEQTESLNAAQFHQMVNHNSGLLGVSETSSDMRDLLEHEHTDERAAEAIALFCYQVRKWIGAFAAALDGLDTLVFAGGIGENAPAIRERICREMSFLGIDLDETVNAHSAALISSSVSKVKVRVIRTDEELMLARLALRFNVPRSD